MKNKFFGLILSIVLAMPISTMAQNQFVEIDELNVENSIEEIDTEDSNIENKNLEELTPLTKQPISKRKILKKFLAAMGGVAVSSFTIFFLLTVYNKFREAGIASKKTFKDTSSLDTPNDIYSAIKVFLNKTDWK